MTKMDNKITGVTEKHRGAFAHFSNGFRPLTEKVYTNKRLKEGRIKGNPQK